MTSEIKDYVSRCETSQSFGRKQCKQTLINHDVPDRPWAKVATDDFTFNNKEYLVTWTISAISLKSITWNKPRPKFTSESLR
ncbi:hypothetical protein DPMN_105445 [Dreissena polymorpha]|uniref:Uncharacterized protein n=1 Tax=Dreissena polymorpha TaxID=45954 RepID=A0A9D4HDT8_DREPO|nr:hypothetical protein DPMN_105445 [Dreissena polymorpha]